MKGLSKFETIAYLDLFFFKEFVVEFEFSPSLEDILYFLVPDLPVVEFDLSPSLEDILYLGDLALLALQPTIQAPQLLVQLDPDI